MGNEPIGLAGLANVAGGPPYTNGDLVNQVSSSPTVNGDQSSYASSVASMSNRSSRANSLIQPGGLHADARHPMGLGIPGMVPNGTNGDHVQASSAAYGGGIPAYAMRPHSASNPVAPSYTYGSPLANGMYTSTHSEGQHPNHYAPQNGQMHGSWGGIFNANGQDGFMAQTQPEQPQIKAEGAMDGQGYHAAPTNGHNDSFLNLYSASQPSTYDEDTGTHRDG